MFQDVYKVINFENLIGNNSDDVIFEDLKIELLRIGIDAILITAVSRKNSYTCVPVKSKCNNSWFSEKEQSWYKKIPRLTLYIRNCANFYSLMIDEHRNTTRISEINDKVINAWKNVITEDLKLDYFDEDIGVTILSFPKQYLVSKVYKLRDDVKRRIKELDYDIIQPKEIYSSSIPSLNIIYADFGDYSVAKYNGDFNLIKDVIRDIFIKDINVDYHSILDKYEYIRFIHPEQKGFSWYGYARQD